MDSSLRDAVTLDLERLAREEKLLSARAAETETALSGLKDMEVLLGLAHVRLTLCLRLMERISSAAAAAEREGLAARVREKALSAFRIVEGLLAENLSEDQRDAVSRDPLYAPVRAALEEFLVRGGGGYLEALEESTRSAHLLSRGIVASIRKYAGEDDMYPPLVLESYPPFVQAVLRFLFPVMIHEKPQMPPYGIGEGEEESTYSSPRMKLPLSQAIFYMENELLPELEQRLAGSPGDGQLQEEISRVRLRVQEYRRLRFFPRSTPVLQEQDFHTHGMTFYTVDGELLVPIPVPVSMRSGTNLDRKMELVRGDLVRRLAGRGICPELDREYRRLRSLESGIRGSSRTASLKIDAPWGFRILKQRFPALGRLQDREGFKELARLASEGSMGTGERRVSALLSREQAEGVPRPRLT